MSMRENVSYIVYENHSQDTRYRDLGKVCQTVSATWGCGGNNQPFVIKQVLTAAEDMINKACGTRGSITQMVTEETVVRRLTPLECERLQGYPDGWTDIGEWTDTKGKTHKDADSPRYKALGNSIALPFWEWMAKRMVRYIDHEPTIASLFDGIGGFPLVFSRAGAVPVWASEIEEFPIAVTKIRFPEKEENE